MSSSSYRSEGKSILPLSRVQKILKADKELPAIAKEAAFLISIATEEFIKKWSVACHKQAQREERVTLRTQDLAVTVRFEEFLFLDELILSTSDHAADVNTKIKPRQPRAPKKDKDGSGNTTSKDKDPAKGRSKGKAKAKELQPPFAYSSGGIAPAQALMQNQATLTSIFSQGTNSAPQFRPAVFTTSLLAQEASRLVDNNYQSKLVPELPELANLDDNDEELQLEKQLSSGRHLRDESSRNQGTLREEEEEEEEDIYQIQSQGSREEIEHEDDVRMKNVETGYADEDIEMS